MESNVKIKRIDTTMIVVLDGRILNRILPEGTDGDTMFANIKQLANELNIEKNDDIYMSKKSKLIQLMLPEKEIIKEQTKLEFNEKSIAEQNQELAYKDLEGAKRIASISGEFEYDTNGYVYLRGFSIPIPEKLAESLLDAHYNPDSKYTVESLVNFWQWVVLNPNKQARIDLFGWFDTGEFVITESGLIVAYRNVDLKSKGIDRELQDFVNLKYVKAKSLKQSPKNYAIFKDGNQYKCDFLKKKAYKDVDVSKLPDYLGLLSDIYSDINTVEGANVYTDNYTHSMIIKMGEEVSMPRQDCNENHNISCSTGLHFMSPAYNLNLGKHTVVILVNPYNIVAFPNYDNTKGRCCAYLPLGLAEKEENKIVTIDSGSYDFEYSKYTSDKLAEIIKNSDFNSLIEDGIIAEDLTEEDFNIVKSQVNNIIQKRIVDVD